MSAANKLPPVMTADEFTRNRSVEWRMKKKLARRPNVNANPWSSRPYSCTNQTCGVRDRSGEVGAAPGYVEWSCEVTPGGARSKAGP